ncbi:MAG: hypothetical protein AB7G16_05725 [Simkaniaceae bacterium]
MTTIINDLSDDWELIEDSQKITLPQKPSNWRILSYLWRGSTQIPEKGSTSRSIHILSDQEKYFEKNKEALQEELKPFFGETLTLDNIIEFVKSINEVYPEYSINPKEDLLEQIRDRKAQMMQKGEESILKTCIGYYALVFAKTSTSVRETLQKTFNHFAESEKYSDPITYEQTILGWFAMRHRNA